MSMAAHKLAEEAMALPSGERARLAQELIASLESSSDTDVEAAWEEVLDRRTREINEGKVRCRPVEETVAELRHRLHAARPQSS